MNSLWRAVLVQEEDSQSDAEESYTARKQTYAKNKNQYKGVVTLSVREKKLRIRVIYQVQKSYPVWTG